MVSQVPNQSAFSGLSAQSRALLSDAILDEYSLDLIARYFRTMSRAGFILKDVKPPLVRMLIRVCDEFLPAVINGKIPPITASGRHLSIDQELLRGVPCSRPQRVLDVGAGYPPVTSRELVDALPRGSTAISLERRLPSYLLMKDQSSYAWVESDGRISFIRDEKDIPRNVLLREYQKFLRECLDAPASNMLTKTSRTPMANVEMVVGDLAHSPVLGSFDIARAMNIFSYYSVQARDELERTMLSYLKVDGVAVAGSNYWNGCEQRYFRWSKVDDRIISTAFTFTLDNAVPLGCTPWLDVWGGCPEVDLLGKFVAIIRNDAELVDALSHYFRESQSMVHDGMPLMDCYEVRKRELTNLRTSHLVGRAAGTLIAHGIACDVTCAGEIEVRI